jgi:dTDP-L-rhamnose 4-epimerase
LGDVRHVVASPARAAEAIGFVAATRFADGMAAFATAPLRAPATGAAPT